MSDEEDGVHKLSGYNHTEGGLIIKKKPKPAEQFEFKIPDVPKGSLLGLDKLAGKCSIIKYFIFLINRPKPVIIFSSKTIRSTRSRES